MSRRASEWSEKRLRDAGLTNAERELQADARIDNKKKLKELAMLADYKTFSSASVLQ